MKYQYPIELDCSSLLHHGTFELFEIVFPLDEITGIIVGLLHF